MLDTETRRRIDSARDVLVGKVPDPKSQVEQITIALIYKFMDDMDKEAISFGGEATFFALPKYTGNKETDEKLVDYSIYKWTDIYNTKVGGHEMLALYSEAIVKLNQNPNIPQLFRDIFKNAYLPYRDPETLKMFLKIINDFKYDHSEMLGDAFEYLLSVLGSQGDAGQFRTPRHIIDFILEVLDPQKNESICDPACGTAGFLISSYKHILKQNSKIKQATENDNHGNPVIKEIIVPTLTPDDRRKMMRNFVGYDISPDMVRLSLANMYLHGFITPNIYEYDTLTSEERWNEYFDVIIANPPFMSPKGGIKPHKKFSIQANRSEVLFIDYIAEHIHPMKGRAGIIVPEGIIFQSAGAYKLLRKMLVDKKYLYAVVSLPAGIFQPYSGVKTSILLMDKTLAKKTDNILFVKIDNDGFDLGAQRRAIADNDLTGALEILQQYKKWLNQDLPDYSDFDDYLKEQNTDSNKETNHGNQLIKKIIVQTVSKKTIAAKDDYNLSIDRYRVNENVRKSNFEMVPLGDICDNLDSKRKPVTASDRKQGKYPYYGASGIVDYVEDYIFDGEYLLVSEDGANLLARVTPIAFSISGKAWVNNHAHILKFEEKVTQTLVELYLNSINLETFITGSAQPKLNQANLNSIPIPLPPLPIQQQIVAKIESYQAIINGAKQVVENYKPQIEINPDWEMVELGEVLVKINDNINPHALKGEVNFIGLENIESNSGTLVGDVKTSYSEIKSAKTKFQKTDILYGKLRPNLNKVLLSTFEGVCSTDIMVLREKKGISNAKFYSSYLISENFNSEVLLGLKGAQLPRVGFEYFSSIKIPLPPLLEQQQIVTRIEQEQQLVNSNKELIKIFEQKIKDEINKLWQAAPKEHVVAEEMSAAEHLT